MRKPQSLHNEHTDPAWSEHRRLYPDQYSHEFVGQRVSFTYDGKKTSGTVTRVMPTRFGLLASIDSIPGNAAIALTALTVIGR